jgi:plastocyanin
LSSPTSKDDAVPERPLAASLLLPLAAVALLATACSSGADAPAGAPAPAAAAPSATTSAPAPPSPRATTSPAAVPVITIAEFSYEVPVQVPAGALVEVVNQDREAHTVTLRGVDGPALVVQGGSTASFRAPAAGSYEIVCDFHGGMTAALVVA